MLSGLENPLHLLLLLLLTLFLFGARRLPEVGRSLGRGLREFKDGIAGKDSNEPARGDCLEPRCPGSRTLLP
jgi:sec-independent protein translocase protein TatA